MACSSCALEGASARLFVPGNLTVLIAPSATNPEMTFSIFYGDCRVGMIMLRDCDILRHFVHLALEGLRKRQHPSAAQRNLPVSLRLPLDPGGYQYLRCTRSEYLF